LDITIIVKDLLKIKMEILSTFVKYVREVDIESAMMVLKFGMIMMRKGI